MDKFELRAGSIEILNHRVFKELFDESYSATLKRMELGDPNNPDAIIQARLELKALQSFKRKLEKAANTTIEEG